MAAMCRPGNHNCPGNSIHRALEAIWLRCAVQGITAALAKALTEPWRPDGCYVLSRKFLLSLKRFKAPHSAASLH